MHVYPRICPVYAPYMLQKQPVYAPYMLRICKKYPVYAPYMQKILRICSVYAKKYSVYAPYMLKNTPYMHVYFRICSVYAPYMPRICQKKSMPNTGKKNPADHHTLEKAKFRVQTLLADAANTGLLEQTLKQLPKQVGLQTFKGLFLSLKNHPFSFD